MSDNQRKTVTVTVLDREPAAPCSLRQACLKAGQDRGGRRCPQCPLRALCESELRWFVKSATRH